MASVRKRGRWPQRYGELLNRHWPKSWPKRCISTDIKWKVDASKARIDFGKQPEPEVSVDSKLLNVVINTNHRLLMPRQQCAARCALAQLSCLTHAMVPSEMTTSFILTLMYYILIFTSTMVFW